MTLTKTSALVALFFAAATGVAVSSHSAEAASASQCGRASWYAMTSRTASGERANPEAMVAAHRSLPFGTMVRVENLGNGRAVTVRINDRGPFVGGRVIDLSRGAAAQLGFVRAGVASVRLSVLDAEGHPAPAACS